MLCRFPDETRLVSRMDGYPFFFSLLFHDDVTLDRHLVATTYVVPTKIATFMLTDDSRLPQLALRNGRDYVAGIFMLQLSCLTCGCTMEELTNCVAIF